MSATETTTEQTRITGGRLYGAGFGGVPVQVVGWKLIGHDALAPYLRDPRRDMDYIAIRVVPCPFDPATRPMPEYGDFHGQGRGGMDRRQYLISRDEHYIYQALGQLDGVWLEADYYGECSWRPYRTTKTDYLYVAKAKATGT